MTIDMRLPAYNVPARTELVSGQAETEAHRVRLQELARPSATSEAAFLAALDTARQQVLASPNVSPGSYADIDRVAESYRWVGMGTPGEPVPDDFVAFTVPGGWPSIVRRNDTSSMVASIFDETTRKSRRSISHDIQDRDGEIRTEFASIIELSEGYRLCEEFMDAGPVPDRRQATFRRNELAQYITGQYGVSLAGVRGQPGANQEYRRGLGHIEIEEPSLVKARAQLSLASARAHFRPLLEQALQRRHGQALDDPHAYASYDSFAELGMEVACEINGYEACPAANYFLSNVMWSLFRGEISDLRTTVERQKFRVAENMSEVLQSMPNASVGGSWLRWWLNDLPYPPQLKELLDAGVELPGVWLPETVPDLETAVVEVVEAEAVAVDVGRVAIDGLWEMTGGVTGPEPMPQPHEELDWQKPGSAEEYEREEATTVGTILIDKRSWIKPTERRLICLADRSAELAPPATDAAPYLRIRFTAKESAVSFTESVPYIPGFILVAETVAADGSRTFDFMKDTTREDPYAMCGQPMSDEHKERLIGYYESIGATRLVKNLRAARRLRIGDVEDMLRRSSNWYAPPEGTDVPAWFVEQEYLHMGCEPAANLELCGLVASGAVPPGAVRIVGGLVLPHKERNGKIDAAGHAAVEYTDPTGRVFILDPSIMRRNMDITHNYTSSSEAWQAPSESAVQGEAPLPPRPDPFEPTRASFERAVAGMFGLGTTNRPATADQVWQHIQSHCRRPGDLVAEVARLVDRASELPAYSLDASSLAGRIHEIEQTAALMADVFADSTLLRRAGGYKPSVGHALLRTLSDLRGVYEGLDS